MNGDSFLLRLYDSTNKTFCQAKSHPELGGLNSFAVPYNLAVYNPSLSRLLIPTGRQKLHSS